MEWTQQGSGRRNGGKKGELELDLGGLEGQTKDFEFDPKKVKQPWKVALMAGDGEINTTFRGQSLVAQWSGHRAGGGGCTKRQRDVPWGHEPRQAGNVNGKDEVLVSLAMAEHSLVASLKHSSEATEDSGKKPCPWASSTGRINPSGTYDNLLSGPSY